MYADLTRSDIVEMLQTAFVEMWPRGYGPLLHDQCYSHTREIISAFRDSETAEEVFQKLVAIPNIEAPTASWLMYAYDPDKFVGLDRYTLTNCLNQHVIHHNDIRLEGGIEKISRTIRDALIGPDKEYKTFKELVRASDGCVESDLTIHAVYG